MANRTQQQPSGHDELIIEGIVSTCDPKGNVHLAAMGPRMARRDPTRLQLRPFHSSQTLDNLRQVRSGVFHITDNVLQLAQVVTKQGLDDLTTLPQGDEVAVLAGVCRWHRFKVDEIDLSRPRATLECSIVHSETERPWCGLNRAQHAIVELAIAATRIGILPDEEIRGTIALVRPWIEKTGGELERQAQSLLEEYIADRL